MLSKVNSHKNANEQEITKSKVKGKKAVFMFLKNAKSDRETGLGYF